MKYIVISFETSDANLRDILIAELANDGYDSFEETAKVLNACCTEDVYNEEVIATLCENYGVQYKKEVVAEQNWNATWERDFKPVIVNDFCAIRADFHEAVAGVAHEIIITPKMSFGTGHHATTRLMVQQMKEIEFNNSTVLDFGTGTGVLAILAEKLGAKKIVAIDNDEWSYDNTLENINFNDVHNIDVLKGSLEVASDEHYDIILANINRHILLEYMNDMYSVLKDGGVIIMSGILTEDEQIVVDKAQRSGFEEAYITVEENWISIRMSKNK